MMVLVSSLPEELTPLYLKMAIYSFSSSSAVLIPVSIASIDIMPANRGHSLVIPKKHYETFDELDQENLKELSLTLQKVAKAVKKIADGYTLLQNNIVEQGVPHVHFHIVPRKRSDSLHFHLPSQKFSQQETNKIKDRIKTLLK